MYLRKSQIDASERRADVVAFVLGLMMLVASICFIGRITAGPDVLIYQIRYLADGKEHKLMTFAASETEAAAIAKDSLPAAEILGLEMLGEWDGTR